MSRLNIWNISTQQIQIFLKAVEFCNFTKVAEYFNYTPSMISKTITAMESELDLKLFERRSRELIPTEAAHSLANDWRQIIGSLNYSILKAHSCQTETGTKIVLGFVDSSEEIDELVQTAVLSFQKLYPDIQIIVEKHDMHRAAELLHLGMLDLIYTSAIEIPFLKEHSLPWERVASTKVCAYIPKNNPLFHQEIIHFEDFKDGTLIALDSQMHPTYNHWLRSICSKYAFLPNIVSTYRTVRSLLFNLNFQNHIFIGETITSDWKNSNLRVYTFEDESFTILSWQSSASDHVLEFKNHLKGFLNI